jgi:hypothetical protein
MARWAYDGNDERPTERIFLEKRREREGNVMKD